jgi:outer membrane protein assembly factor BamB
MAPRRAAIPIVIVSLAGTSLLALDLKGKTSTAAATAEWPEWRGPHRDGVSTEKGLLKSWDKGGPPLLWKATGLGGGFSSVAISGGKIFTLGEKKGGAHLVVLDLATQKQLWTTPVGGGEPNSTPTVDGDLVFALGRDGDLVCARTASGEMVWKKNFGKDFGGKMMSGWGYSESPLVDGENVIVTPGARDAMIVALAKQSGDAIWKAAVPADLGQRGQDGAGYSSIVVSEACGVRQYIQLVGRGVISIRAKDGKFLWGYNKIANDTANIPTPIVKGDFVFTSTGYGAGAALLKVVPDGDGVKTEEVYFLSSSHMQNHHGGMVLVGNHIYAGHGHGEGFPLCIDMMTGKVAWKPGRGPGEGSAALVYADGNLYFRYENGTMALIEASPEKYVLLGSFEIASRLGKSWPHPAIAGGRLFLRDQDVLLCYDVKEGEEKKRP